MRKTYFLGILTLILISCDSEKRISASIENCIVDNTTYSTNLESPTNLVEIGKKFESVLIDKKYLKDKSLASYKDLVDRINRLSVKNRQELLEDIFFKELEGLYAAGTFNSSLHCYKEGISSEKNAPFFNKVTKMLDYESYDTFLKDILSHNYSTFESISIIYRLPILNGIFLKLIEKEPSSDLNN